LRRVRDYMQAVRAILWKDLVVEWRSHELVSGMLVFAILAILIFNFALDLEIHTSAGLSSGILWVTLVFSGTVGLNRSMAAEKDRGCLEGLLLAPVDRSAIFFGKVLGNWLFMLLVAVILLPIYSVLYSVNLFNAGLLIVVVLGTAGYALTGTLLAAMSIQTRAREMLLPILLFPVAFPLMLAAVKAGSGFLQGFTLIENQSWIALLVDYDVIFTALGLMFFDVIMEE
jgi:heme exporter protein B